MKRLFLFAVITTGAILLDTGNMAFASDTSTVFETHEKSPVLRNGPDGAWDAFFLDPGAMTVHDGMFHMFYSGLPSWPYPLAIGYANSVDGIDWTRHSQSPILTIEDTGLEGESINSDSVMVTDDGTWILYFSVIPNTRGWVGNVGRATAPTPMGPWTVDSEPVLTPGSDGSWDEKAVGHAHVVRAGNEYRMYYSGTGEIQVGEFAQEHTQIGLAISDDGKNWTKFNDPKTATKSFAESDPVFAPSEVKDAWDSWHVRNSRVQWVGDRWRMVYGGSSYSESGNFGMAESSDGIVWSRTFDVPIIESTKFGKIVFFNSYIHHQGEDLIYLEAGKLNESHAFLAVRKRQ